MTPYQQLSQIKNEYPALTFNNQGYQYLSREVKEKHTEQIKQIETILKNEFSGIVEFNNFKPRKDGAFDIRCQCKYDPSFTGVVYLKEADFTAETVQIL